MDNKNVKYKLCILTSNRCFACRLLVEIIFSAFKQVFHHIQEKTDEEAPKNKLIKHIKGVYQHLRCYILTQVDTYMLVDS